MFEFSVAAKYLLPKRRQLSSSIISLISCAVIALVVWLILVFFSVTNGLERLWIEKLITLTAPVRITPTNAYFQSWYYQIDTISQDSDYEAKTLEEKLQALKTDPYDPQIDQEVPSNWAAPLLDEKGNPVDLVKGLFASIEENRSFPFHTTTYEGAQGLLKFQTKRPHPIEGVALPTGQFEEKQQDFSQLVSVVSLDEENELLFKTLIPLDSEDLTNLYRQSSRLETLKEALWESGGITSWKSPPFGWPIPPPLYPDHGKIIAQDIGPKGGRRTLLLSGTPPKDGVEINFVNGKVEGSIAPLLILDKGYPMDLNEEGVISFSVQGLLFKGIANSSLLEVAKYSDHATDQTPWIHQREGGLYILPYVQGLGDGLLLPKGFRDHGARVGDQGIITYESPSMSMNQQKQIPVYIAGFYDQGIMALGGKFVLAPKEVASLVRSQTNADLLPQSNGVHVRFLDYQKAPELKKQIEKSLQARGLTPYFKVESYDEYDFIRPFLQELHSQKNLFTILAGIIIVVACSNIISMLIILVNDKKKEIGILRSMGATTLSIASIFGFAGLMMGLVGSIIGICAAIFTLDHISSILKLLGHLQGHAAFGSLFFGDRMPTELSVEALRFVLIATSVTSLLSGLVPAIKACLVRPAATLRSE